MNQSTLDNNVTASIEESASFKEVNHLSFKEELNEVRD
jgi:hypothetical protein